MADGVVRRTRLGALAYSAAASFACARYRFGRGGLDWHSHRQIFDRGLSPYSLSA